MICFVSFQMEEIFAIPGLYHISRKICHGLNLKSLQNLSYTNKTILNYCTSIWMERFLNQKHGFPPPYMKRGLEFDSALKIFLNHLVISFQHKINFIDKTGLNKLSFQSQVKFIPTNVPITMHYQLLKILCIAIYYQDLESVKSLLRPMKEYDTCVRTLIKANKYLPQFRIQSC